MTEKKGEYTRCIRIKKEEFVKDIVKKIEECRNEKELWRVTRKSREGVSNKIKKEEWYDYFKKSYKGLDEESIDKVTRRIGIEISEEEVNRAIRKLKKRKAAGEDGIKSEAWIEGGTEVRKILTQEIKKIGKGGEIPKGWTKGVATPVSKKGSKEKVENYRGITLMDTDYKIYSEILREKLEKKVEEKRILQDTQMGFRKKRRTRDAIMLLKKVIDKGVKNKKKVNACFVDLTVAFHKVNRKKLWKILEKAGINEGLIKEIRELFEETKCEIRVNGTKAREFWTKKGLKQGCPLSGLLFIIYMAETGKNMRNYGIKINGEKIAVKNR